VVTVQVLLASLPALGELRCQSPKLVMKELQTSAFRGAWIFRYTYYYNPMTGFSCP